MKPKFTWIGIILIVAIGFGFGSLRVVFPGQVGITHEGSSLKLLKPGIHLVRPFSHFHRYDLVKIHRLNGKNAVRVSVASGKTLAIDCEVGLSISSDNLIDLERRYGGRIFEKVILPVIRKSLRDLLANGRDLSRHELASSLIERVNDDLKPMGLWLTGFEIKALKEVSQANKNLKPRSDVRVFVLGLDGFDWLIVDEVSKKHPLANLDRIRREGAWGNLLSLEPMVSPLIWTTIATGVTPDIHGVTDFLIKDEETGKDVPITSSMRKVPAIWNITSFAGITTGVIGWFATYPSEQVKGFMVSDRFAHHMFDPNWTMGGSVSWAGRITYPEDLYPKLDSLRVEPQSVKPRLSDFIKGQIGKIGASYDPRDPISGLSVALSSFLTYRNLMEYLYRTYRPQFFAVYFSFTDDALHLFIRYMEPPMKGVSREEARRYGSAVYEAYVEADRLVGEILDLIDDSTVLIVVSDHGFKSGDMRPSSDPRMGFGQATDWHRLNGVIGMYGPGIKKGARLSDPSVLDVAPTLLYILGLPPDRRMQGKVLVDAFTEDLVRQNPVQEAVAYDSLLDFEVAGEAKSIADEGLKAKLVSLGYIAGGSSSLVNLANYYHRSGKYEEAIEIWKKLIDQDPNDLGAMIGMSNAYSALGKHDLAINGLRQVLDKDPRNLKAIHSLATIYLNQGRASDAMAMAERAIAIDPSDGMGYLNKGSAFQLMGKEDEATEQYLLAISHSPDLAEAYGNLAQIYIGKNMLDKALEFATKGLEIEPSRAPLHYVMGMVYDAQGEAEKAIKSYSNAVALDSSFVPGYLAAGGLFLRRGDFDRAIEFANKAIRHKSPYRVQAYDLRGTTYFARRDLEKARADYQAAIEVDPNYIPARINLAKVFLSEGKPQIAVKQLEAALAIQPNNPEAQTLLRAVRSGRQPTGTR